MVEAGVFLPLAVGVFLPLVIPLRLLLAEQSAQAEARTAPAPWPMSVANAGGRSLLSNTAMLRETARVQTEDTNGANLCALELYTPRHCASAATMEAHYGCSGMHTSSLHTEQYAACGEDEDASDVPGAGPGGTGGV